MGRRTTTAAEELARNDDAETAAASGSDAQTPCASEDASGDLSSLDRPARRRRRGGERGKKSRARSSNARDDALARQYLWQAGLNYEHSTGHGVGHFLSVHEGPIAISSNPDQVPALHAGLEPGMILSNEPGYYEEGAFGIRVENLVVVQPRSEGK